MTFCMLISKHVYPFPKISGFFKGYIHTACSLKKLCWLALGWETGARGGREREKLFYDEALGPKRDSEMLLYCSWKTKIKASSALKKKGALDDVLEEKKSVKKKGWKREKEGAWRFYNFEFSSQLLAKVKNLGIKPGIYGRVEAASHLHGSLGQGGGIKLGRVPRRGEKCIVVHLAVKKTFFLGHKCL